MAAAIRKGKGFAGAPIVLRRWMSSRCAHALATAEKNELAAKAEQFVDDDFSNLENVEKVLERIGHGGFQADSSRYALLLRSCSDQRALAEGKLVHAHILKSGYLGDTFLGNLLIDMYGKCGNLEDARVVFEGIRERNIFSWTILLTSYSRNGYSREVLKLVQHMDLEGIKPEKVAFLSLLDACCRLLDSQRGKQIHLRIVECGLDSNVVVGNALISMYGKCGDSQNARVVFDGLPEKNVVSWNAVIAAYARNGHGNEALHMFRLMDLEGAKPDRITFISLVEACTKSIYLAEGKLVHARVVASGLDSDVVIGTSLVSMYGKSSSLEDAKAAFDRMPWKNVVTWNAMISAFNQNYHPREALELFQEMKEVQPDKVTFITALEACATLGSLGDGREIHASIVSSGFNTDLVLGNTVINMYGKCNSPVDARSVFDRMLRKDVVSWNTMMAAYSRNACGKEAMELFHEMLMQGIVPDKYSFLTALDACGSLGSIEQGREIHERIRMIGFMSDVALGTALLNMYGKCGLLDEARNVFDGMGRKSIVTWNTMISVYAHHGYPREAIELFEQMDVKPDKVTFACILDACTSLQALSEGRRIHARIVEGGFEKDIVVDNTLINLYGICGSVEEARNVFDGIQQKDVVSWNAIIRAYAHNERAREALGLFYEMEEKGMKPDRVSFVGALDACASMGGAALLHGKTVHASIIGSKLHLDIVVGTALVTMYGKCGSVEDAKFTFDEMRCRNAVTWTAMIAAYSQNGRAEEALKLFEKMDQEGCPPDKITFISVLEACGSLEELALGKKLHSRVDHIGLSSDVIIQTSLVSMYGKCGCLETARSLFKGMNERTVISWNAMISAYARNGHTSEVLQLFKEMELKGVRPDRVTYMAVLDTACTNLSSSEGRKIHETIISNGFETDALVGTALLNLYTKSGKLAEARRLFNNLSFKDVVAWTSMIAAYAEHGHSKLAVDLFQEMLLDGMQPDDIVFISVLFACSHEGMFPQGWQYFVSMRGDHEIEPLADHYGCMVDLLARAGRLSDAEDLIHSMPFKPDGVMWTALLGACKLHGDLERGARVAEAMESDDHAGSHVLLSNIYAAAGMLACILS